LGCERGRELSTDDDVRGSREERRGVEDGDGDVGRGDLEKVTVDEVSLDGERDAKHHGWRWSGDVGGINCIPCDGKEVGHGRWRDDERGREGYAVVAARVTDFKTVKPRLAAHKRHHTRASTIRARHDRVGDCL